MPLSSIELQHKTMNCFRLPPFFVPFIIGMMAVNLSTCERDKKDHSVGPHVRQPDGEEGLHEGDGSHLPLKMLANEESIQNDLVNTRCLSCHGGASEANRNVDLRNIGLLVRGRHHGPGHVSDGSRHGLIVPGCPDESFFYTIMKQGNMPPAPAERVSAETLKIVEDWIISLKKDGDPECGDDEPPDTVQDGSDEP